MGLAILLVLLIPSSCERGGKLNTPDSIRRLMVGARQQGAKLGTGLREGTSKRLKSFGGTVAGHRQGSQGSQASQEVQKGQLWGKRSLNLMSLGGGASRNNKNSNTNGKNNTNGNNKSGPSKGATDRDTGLVGVAGPLPHGDSDHDYWEEYEGDEDDEDDDDYDDDEEEEEEEEDVRGRR